ncbi:MAG: ribokinase [Gemmataceae bacterium]
MPKVCVVGSANLDLNAAVERFPAPGETLHGRSFSTGFGGKGANQAVMAARRGAEVRFIARVGTDPFGRDMLEHFRSEGIDTRHVRLTEGVSTGAAVITIDAQGRNTIVVVPGANGMLTAADIEAARDAIESAGALVCQMEVPWEANAAAIRIANAAGVPVLFNPSPAPERLPDSTFADVAVLCLNETEASILTGVPAEESEACAKDLLGRGVPAVVLTLGERGCLLGTKSLMKLIPAPRVPVVDTTGAGDAFLGSLAFDLAAGLELEAAAVQACRVAALSVQRPGTQASYPRKWELG